jgi:hypothetical protein
MRDLFQEIRCGIGNVYFLLRKDTSGKPAAGGNQADARRHAVVAAFMETRPTSWAARFIR